MTLKDTLQKAVEIIGEDIDLETTNAKRTKLIACGNMIYQELCNEYIDMKYKENIVFLDNKAYYTAFSKSVKDVLGIYYYGKIVPFKVYPLYIEADINGEAEVLYTYNVSEKGINDELELSPKYTPFALANGIASEYFYRSGFVDEAIFYKNRYDTAILNLSRNRKGIFLKRTGRIGCNTI